MDYNKLSQTAHAAALKNGWYEGEQVSINTKLALIKSEIYEAFDSFRDGKYADTKGWVKEINLHESEMAAFASDLKFKSKTPSRTK